MLIELNTGTGRAIRVQTNPSNTEGYITLETPQGDAISAALSKTVLDDLIDALEKIRTELEA